MLRKNSVPTNTITVNSTFTNANDKSKDYSKAPINIQLKGTADSLNQVVVIGYSTAKRKFIY